MNAQMLLENFGAIANAPGGVKRLREMIYYLGVTGALCRQDPTEGTGALLLAQIEEEKRNKVSRNNFKRSPKLENLQDKFSESLPVIPKIWTWTRLIDIGEISPKNESEDDAMASFASMSAISEMHGVPVQPENRPWETIKKGFTHFANRDVVVAKITPCFENGKAAVIRDLPNEIGAGTTELHVVRPLSGIEPDFIYIFLRSPYFKIVGEGYMTGTAGQKRLPSEYFATRPFPLPPTAEQKRIVAKVDELMALCDNLEAQQQERERRFPVLSRACHARFVESPTLANLKAIFDEVESVSTEDLRKTILDLAVQGRLVRQELSDPVPSETFDEIKPIKIINDRFPKSWIIYKYENLTDLITSGSRGWKEYYSNSGAIFVRAQNIKTDCLILNDIAYVSLPNKAEGKRSLIKRWDILITITGANVTKTALVKDDISEAYVSQHIALTRPKWPEMAEWLYLCFVSPAIGRGELERLAYGDKPGLNLNNIRDLKFPIPPLNEQHRIVAKVDQLMALIDKLEEQQARKAKVAQAFAQAAVSAITGTEIKEPEKMKAPKTELVSRLQTRNKPNAADPAPLAKLLTEHNGELPAKMLWQRSGLEIDAFYQQLRTEMANGWIIEPEKAVMKEIEAD